MQDLVVQWVIERKEFESRGVSESYTISIWKGPTSITTCNSGHYAGLHTCRIRWERSGLLIDSKEGHTKEDLEVLIFCRTAGRPTEHFGALPDQRKICG